MIDLKTKIINLINNLYFLLNVIFIFFIQFIIYSIYLDYSNLIDNITHKLARTNILYVKIFQSIALNNNLIDDKINAKLLKFTDNAPWVLSDINYYDLIEMTDRYNIILPEGYEKPINSGMISIIFKGYDKNTNKQIIIKMKRNKIEEKLNKAILNIKFLMYILSFIPIIHKYKIGEVINKNIDIILQQTNFHQEVKNILKVTENCKNLKYVKIPEVYSSVI